jgi:hypothetical protein
MFRLDRAWKNMLQNDLMLPQNVVTGSFLVCVEEKENWAAEFWFLYPFSELG